MMKNVLLAVATVAVAAAFATPVEVDWKAGETAPAKVARPFAGFIADGSFIVAGGSNFIDGKRSILRTSSSAITTASGRR